MSGSLSGKFALVGASSRGIGYAIAELFHREGAGVCICARGEAAVAEAAERIAGKDRTRLVALAGDLGDAAFVARLVAAGAEGLGGSFDILVNNCGGPPTGLASSTSDEVWRSVLDRNLLSAIRLSTLVLPGMKKKGWGRIINLTSTTAREPGDGMVYSSVARAGVAAFAKTLSREVGPNGITVNTILTGGCLTDRLHSLMRQEAEAKGETPEAVLGRAVSAIPTRYIATPAEFARTILFVASEQAGYMTGVSLPLDGGHLRGLF